MRHILRISAVLAMAVVLATLQTTTPPYAMLTGPIRTGEAASETVAGKTFSLDVGDIAKARIIAYDQFGKAVELESSGVWIVVSAELRGFVQTMPIRAATIVGASGRLYRQSERAGGAPNILSLKTLQPGLPTTGLFIFELPEDETAEMTLRVSEQYDPQLQDEIAVSLASDATAPQERLEIGPNGI
ncbi:MAG: hypothetical protein P0Y65_20440 [Candidatus Devosia phytovorans]|uniref:DUF4352 domain-containing protein n=1 Tax=Candidatus Devosia phytovorans TaxID=3121372 RepID=A0AAJ5VUE6_9HYPH|nr:hypothetical protein [Devosia sp.]WEK04512.1 MAG: hypothetical protein P0Y65_20440 [Devosia sp.]